MTDRVAPDARRRDAIAVSILAAGALVAAYGYIGLHVMATGAIVRVPGQSAMQRAISYNEVMYAGLAIVAVGVCAVAWSFWRYRRQQNPPE